MQRFNRIFYFLLLIFLLCGCKQPPAAADNTPFLDKVVFVGDSTTAHMKNRSKLNDAQVWATKERYLNLDARVTSAKIEIDEKEMTIAEAAAKYRPAYLVITLGIDYGVYYYRDDPETFRACYEKLLDTLQTAAPDTVLILQSVFPVGRQSPAITNEMVDRANTVISEIAAARDLYYLDANTPLRDEEGYLRPEYVYSADGIHLTASAYDVILENLRSKEREIMGGSV